MRKKVFKFEKGESADQLTEELDEWIWDTIKPREDADAPTWYNIRKDTKITVVIE